MALRKMREIPRLKAEQSLRVPLILSIKNKFSFFEFADDSSEAFVVSSTYKYIFVRFRTRLEKRFCGM